MEEQRLNLCISRYDHYYDSINNKANVMLALISVIMATLLTSYPWINENVNCGAWINTLMTIQLSIGFGNLILVALVAMPYVKKGGTSLLYFGTVADMTKERFFKSSMATTNESELADLRHQVHVLAKGLRIKFQRLRIASVLLILQFLFAIPLVILIVKNIK